MTIKQQGGIFGRNPSFNEVTVGNDISKLTQDGVNAYLDTEKFQIRAPDGSLIGLQYNPDDSGRIQLNFGGNAKLLTTGAGVSVTGSVAVSDGGGINFSATSGTGTSELFDDYEEGTWTPAFSAEWTTPPSVTSAQYTKIGRQVTVTLLASGGVVTAGGSITGLPFASNSAQGAGAYGGNSDTTESLQGTVGQSASSITNIPARTLTGDTWQITATYFT